MVDHLKLRIDEHNAAWRGFFESCSTEAIEVFYEELVEDYEVTIVRILREVGIPTPQGFVVERPGMKRRSDETSEEWVRMYHEGEREHEASRNTKSGTLERSVKE